MTTDHSQLCVPKDEADYLRESMRVVRHWLSLLMVEELDAHTLGTIHACIQALGANNPRLAAASAIGEEIDRWAQLLVDHIESDGAEMAYAAILRRAGDMLEQRKIQARNGGYQGPRRELVKK